MLSDLWQVLIKSDPAKDKNGTQMRNAVRQVYYDMVGASGKNSGIKMIVDVDTQNTM